jgi:hypothetical protein
MRRSSVAATTAMAAAIAGAVAVSAQGKPEAPVKPAAAQQVPSLSTKPYSRLFEQQRSEAAAALWSKMKPNSARRFICGTPVLPADSAIDPKFEMRPRDTTTRFSLRVVAPGQCH